MAIHKIKIFSGRGSEYLAEKIAASFGTTLGQSEVLRFSDGEFQPCYNESIRGCTVFIIQSTFPPSDNLMEPSMMIDAARRASAYKVVAVIPYFGWARQDRKDRPRVPIGAKLVANLLMAAGVDRVMTMDLHADQIQGFFDVPVDALYASGIFIPYIESLKIEDLSIAAPDMGGAKTRQHLRKTARHPDHHFAQGACQGQRRGQNDGHRRGRGAQHPDNRGRHDRHGGHDLHGRRHAHVARGERASAPPSPTPCFRVRHTNASMTARWRR